MDTLEKRNHNKKITWPWREWFSKPVLENGRRDEENGKIIDFEVDPSGTRGTGTSKV
ncbi:MAG: hypothetical protein UHU21_06240 [Lachnospiraceae bacterium]|jgi:hypothetical protein|nr:hypothetical protein [Lachnospiraceae bacterium]